MCLLSRANSLKSVIPGMLDCLSVNIGYAFVKKLVNRAVIAISRPEFLTVFLLQCAMWRNPYF